MSAAVATGVLRNRATAAQTKADIRLGIFIGMGKDPDGAIKKVAELGFPTCQVAAEEFAPEMASRLREASGRNKVEITAISTTGPGKHVWDFYQGPLTIGVVPPETRAQRVAHIKKASDFAKLCGVAALHSHAGFIPENPSDPLYRDVVAALREVCEHCKSNGQIFLYETGQESPITLLRTIQDVGTNNQYVNLDTANLILYGKGNPLDALDVVGNLVRGIHAKDGLFPTDPRQLGRETPIGQGKVDFAQLIKRLRQLNYRGAMTIEREISGPKQIDDIRQSKEYLEKLLAA